MYRIDKETEFFPDGEQITTIPPSFKLLAQDGNSYVYGSGRNGREVEWVFLRDYGGWGWLVRRIEVEPYDCCGSG